MGLPPDSGITKQSSGLSVLYVEGTYASAVPPGDQLKGANSSPMRS